jgi:hypothetical protein
MWGTYPFYRPGSSAETLCRGFPARYSRLVCVSGFLQGKPHKALFFHQAAQEPGSAYEMHDSAQNCGGSPHVTFVKVESPLS